MFRAGQEGFKVKEVPYTYSFRKRGSTKTSPNLSRFLALGGSYVRAIVALRFSKRREQSAHASGT